MIKPTFHIMTSDEMYKDTVKWNNFFFLYNLPDAFVHFVFVCILCIGSTFSSWYNVVVAYTCLSFRFVFMQIIRTWPSAVNHTQRCRFLADAYFLSLVTSQCQNIASVRRNVISFSYEGLKYYGSIFEAN